jgi:hypothetical protein
MLTEEYLGRSRLFRRLKNGPHGQLVERYAARLVEDGLVRQGTWRCLNVVGDLLSWIASRRMKLTDLDERMVERYLLHRGGKQSIQPGDRAALKRWLSVLRDAGTIVPAPLPPISPQDQIPPPASNRSCAAHLRADLPGTGPHSSPHALA